MKHFFPKWEALTYVYYKIIGRQTVKIEIYQCPKTELKNDILTKSYLLTNTLQLLLNI
jgi:hypothetical protein